VELENGHRLMGHTSRSTSGLLEGAQPGETVVLEVGTYDLSKGRVVNRNKKNENE
jgi:translation initiation factor IF-1|tara:strand:- start:640 stop:804 length:165 start_codon:yes stop_codon:yes gene_type:complete